MPRWETCSADEPRMMMFGNGKACTSRPTVLSLSHHGQESGTLI
jgi:hypothetical protein